MFKRVISFFKKWLEGFILELKGPKVCGIEPCLLPPSVVEEIFQSRVNVFSLGKEPRVYEEKPEDEMIQIKNCSLSTEISLCSGNLEISTIGTQLFDRITLETGCHSEHLSSPIKFHSVSLHRPVVLSKANLPVLRRIRVRRETRVDKRKMEGALRVLLMKLKGRQFERIGFIGYYKNVPPGKFFLVNEELFVNAEKGPSKDLMVFEIKTKGSKLYIFIPVQ
ncbi:hypothetical protein [Thermotoga sp.]|uniref:hypothetical protein n=1 Tax=Thermotoga sp. TaxID=28240 RepID=UPI0025DA2B3B|nr:hypothetical protein [Thermotoga sp.]MCD6551955.1 hypothetical protein [Thermotoga sp.]